MSLCPSVLTYECCIVKYMEHSVHYLTLPKSHSYMAYMLKSL